MLTQHTPRLFDRNIRNKKYFGEEAEVTEPVVDHLLFVGMLKNGI